MAARMRLVLSLSASIPLTGSEAAAHKRREKEKKGKLVRLGSFCLSLGWAVPRYGLPQAWIGPFCNMGQILQCKKYYCKGKLVRLGNWSEFLLVSRLGRSEIWASTGLDWAVLQHGPDPAMQKILLYSFARRRVRTSDLVVNSHTL
jgi:hypothetical protein